MTIPERSNSLYGREILNGSFYPKTKAYYYKEWDDFSMPFHTHNAVEIMYVIHGKCLVETGDASMTLKKGEFILLDAGISHRLQVEKDKPCRMLNIEFGFALDCLNTPSFGTVVESSGSFGDFLEARRPYIILKDSEEIYITLKSLIMELDQNNGKESFLLQLLFAQLFVRLSRLYCETAGPNSGTGMVHVKKAVQYIHQNYDKDIGIKDIATAARVHAGYLHRIFKSSRGMTINRYLMNVRMGKAMSLLANTDIPITDISGYIGLNSSQYFNFTFKKTTGCTPSAYRKSVVKAARNYS